MRYLQEWLLDGIVAQKNKVLVIISKERYKTRFDMLQRSSAWFRGEEDRLVQSLVVTLFSEFESLKLNL